MATLRERQKQFTRETLLNTAMELFGENRYLSTTIDEIATTAGTNRATFYLHFKSKSDIMRALLEKTDQILTEIDDPPLADVIAANDPALIYQYINNKFDQWPVIKPYIMMAHQAAPGDPEVAALMETWFESVAQDIKQGLDRGDRFDPESRRLRGVLAFGQLEYVSVRWFRYGWLQPREDYLALMGDTWCHLLIDPELPRRAGS